MTKPPRPINARFVHIAQKQIASVKAKVLMRCRA
jgi:hypothetical protein